MGVAGNKILAVFNEAFWHTINPTQKNTFFPGMSII